MNNHRLLTVLLVATLLSDGASAVVAEERVISLDELFEIAEANSIQLRPLFTAEEMAQREIDVARSARLPEVNTSLSISYIGPILVEVPPINRNLSYWYVGVGISYNLSSLYKNNKSLAKSRISTRLASEKLDAARENISLGVRADYTRYLEAYEELKTQQKSVELADRNYRTTSTRYSADMALITDMLDAASSKLSLSR